MKRSAVDGVLAEWDDAAFDFKGVRRRTGRIERGPTGMPAGRSAVPGPSLTPAAKAEKLRGKLRSVVRRVPEVMVKISGGGKGMRQIKAHFDYISRNGQIALEDQDGLVTANRTEVGDLRDSWQVGGYPVPEESYVREAFNIVLSMPEGTDEIAVHRAAHDFAAVTFPAHQYALALHTFDTDPDPEPARHPHVHLVVKARSMSGVRLNPRKSDLQSWREAFAKALGDHGIEAAATPRRLRQQGQRSIAIGNMKSAERAGATRLTKAYQWAYDVRYQAVLDALARSEDREDRRLAVALEERLGRNKGRSR